MVLKKIGKWTWVFGFIALTSTVWGQVEMNSPSLTMADRIIPIPQPNDPVLSIRQSAPLYTKSVSQIPASPAHIIHLPSTSPHAFFCKMELLIEKRSSVPFIFRLGDVDQVNRMEGKIQPWIR